MRANLLDVPEGDGDAPESQERTMYFLLTREVGIVDVKQYRTLEALIEQELQDKNPDNIKKCLSAEEFMGLHPSVTKRGLLIIEGDVLSVHTRQHVHTTWSIGSDKKETGEKSDEEETSG